MRRYATPRPSLRSDRARVRGTSGQVRPDGACPRFQRPVFEPFTPKPFEQQIAEERITAPGAKTRQFANVTVPQPTQAAYGQSYGLGAPMETGSTPAVGFAQ